MVDVLATAGRCLAPEYGQTDVMLGLSALASAPMLHLCAPDLRQQAGTWLAGSAECAKNAGIPLSMSRSNSAQSRLITE